MSNFENTLQTIASIDVKTLVKKDAEYGSSWKKRGGIGAFMMLARKWDRLETQMTVEVVRPNTPNDLTAKIDSYDVFRRIEAGVGGDESILETIRDLRRYLLLVESEIVLHKQVDRGGTQPYCGTESGIGRPPEGEPIPGLLLPAADDEYARPYQPKMPTFPKPRNTNVSDSKAAEDLFPPKPSQR